MYYIESPFQLLQLFELQKLEGFRAEPVFIRLNGESENDKQLRKLVKYLAIKNVCFVKIVSTLDKFMFLIRFMAKINKQKKLIIGDANSFLFKIISKLYNYKQFLLLDDGVATLNDSVHTRKYERFTIFDKGVNKPLINQFSQLAKLNKNRGKRPVHVIVGSKFIEAGITTKANYQKTIEFVINHLIEQFDESEELIYIPHRGENPFHISQILRDKGVSEQRLGLPIELIGAELEVEVRSVSHILSTAVFSMAKIYPGASFFTFRFPSKSILKRQGAVESIYEVLQEQNTSKFINVEL